MTIPRSPLAVITGAGSGFGRALAFALASRGAHLVLADVNEASAAETARVCMTRGAKAARSLRCDVSKLDEVESLAASCKEPIDLVVNNAGVSSGGRIGESPMADWRWTIEVDLFGVIYGCHAFVPIFRTQGHGHVLNVASAAGLVSAPRMGAYNVSKAGVVALSETLAAELAGTKIGVTVLCPTFFQTDIAKSGRFPDARTKVAAEKLVAKGKTAESIANAALRSVESDQLYCVPMMDAQLLWRLKRFVPGLFVKLVGKVAEREMFKGE